MKIALITVIENDENNINNISNEYSKKRLYESEAILCFENWRKNAGWLKDIPIYTYCPTKNTPSNKTINRLNELNVTYIEKYIPETETYFCGYWNVPLVGMIFEETLKEDIFIHIDLDMNIIKPLPKTLVKSVSTNDFVICGQYDDYAATLQRNIPDRWQNPLDTGFIISHKDSMFYKNFYNELKILTQNKGDDIWKKYMNDRPLRDLEEYVMDKHLNLGYHPKIKPIQKYQIGEFYTPVSNLTHEEITNVYFWHEHILFDDEYNRAKEKIAYFRVTKGNNLLYKI